MADADLQPKADNGISSYRKSEAEMSRIVIADINGIIRAGLRAILERTGYLSVIGEASSGDELIEICARLRPDAVITGILLHGRDGISALRQIKAAQKNVRAIVYSAMDNPHYVCSALSAGADGYVIKDSPPACLLQAVDVTRSGACWIDKKVASDVFAQSHKPVPVPVSIATSREKYLSQLTPREIDVLKLLAAGLTNAEISAKLFLNAETIKTHIRHILEKLHVRNRTEAALKSVALELTDPWASIA